jgi:O-methyltransferase
MGGRKRNLRYGPPMMQRCAWWRPVGAIKVLAVSSGAAAALRANRILGKLGLEIRRVRTAQSVGTPQFPDLEPWVADIINKVRPFTMTSEERISALCHAVRYIVRSNIPGDIVECGVWRGGSMMAAAVTLLAEGCSSRTLHLFDTFEGMPPPTSVDRAAESGKLASDMLDEADRSSNIWAYAPIEEVRRNLASVGYAQANIRFVKGDVQNTIPAEAPQTIAILRLDTDWYESTKHELEHLFPRLTVGGVLIIDDYGYWDGARKAVDEYVSSNNVALLLNRIDGTGRIAVKLPSRFLHFSETRCANGASMPCQPPAPRS